MSDLTRNGTPLETELCTCGATVPLGRACHAPQQRCIGYRDQAEADQPCPTGDWPEGSKHRCESCRAEHQRARQRVKQARYRRRRQESLGRLDQLDERLDRLHEAVGLALRTVQDHSGRLDLVAKGEGSFAARIEDDLAKIREALTAYDHRIRTIEGRERSRVDLVEEHIVRIRNEVGAIKNRRLADVGERLAAISARQDALLEAHGALIEDVRAARSADNDRLLAIEVRLYRLEFESNRPWWARWRYRQRRQLGPGDANVSG